MDRYWHREPGWTLTLDRDTRQRAISAYLAVVAPREEPPPEHAPKNGDPEDALLRKRAAAGVRRG